jgi:hypothetical protein
LAIWSSGDLWQLFNWDQIITIYLHIRLSSAWCCTRKTLINIYFGMPDVLIEITCFHGDLLWQGNLKRRRVVITDLSSVPPFTRPKTGQDKKEASLFLIMWLYRKWCKNSIPFWIPISKSLQVLFVLLICLPSSQPPPATHPQTWNGPKLEKTEEKNRFREFQRCQHQPTYKSLKIENHPWCWSFSRLENVRQRTINRTVPKLAPQGHGCKVSMTGGLGGEG